MRRYIVTFAFALAFFVALATRGANPHSALSKDVWLKAQSKHFTLISDARESEIRGVATRLEQFREAFLRLFPPLIGNTSVPVTVILFKNDAEYTRFKPLYQGKPADVSGYFQSSGDAAYITLAVGRGDRSAYAIIFHEYVHALMSDGARPLPTWLSEGLAEYFSAFEVSGGGKRVWLGKAVASHARLLRERASLPLETLLAVDQASPFYIEAEKKNLFYAQSWALTHYLLHAGGGRRDQFRQFISALAQGEPTDKSFKLAFQTDYATVEQELKNYIRQGAYPVEEILLDQQIAFDAEMRALALSEAEVQAYLGDLLWRIHRSVDGEALLNRALSIDAKLAMAHLSLGTLRLRQNRYAEAQEHLRKAIAAGSQNHLAHYYYAFAIHRQQVDESQYVSEMSEDSVKEMRAALNRARQLNPNFADTYKLLAFINLVLGEGLDEALNLINRAISLAPHREDIIYTQAQIQMRRKDYAAARQIARRLAVAASKPDLRERASWMLENIAKIEERMAKMKAEGEQSTTPANSTSKRPPLPGENFQGDQVRGFLTRIDCDETSVTLTVSAQSRVFKLRSSQPQRLIFIRYTPDVPTSLTCGALNPAKPVIVTYRASPQANSDGEAIGVEFVKPDDL